MNNLSFSTSQYGICYPKNSNSCKLYQIWRYVNRVEWNGMNLNVTAIRYFLLTAECAWIYFHIKSNPILVKQKEASGVNKDMILRNEKFPSLALAFFTVESILISVSSTVFVHFRIKFSHLFVGAAIKMN